MPALSEMSPAEQRLHGHSENKERYVKASRFIRELTIDRAYTLREELDGCQSQEERDALMQDWAAEAGRDTGALKDDLAWTAKLKEHDLRGVFTAQRIEAHEWQKRIGVSHLRRIGKAFNLETGELLTSSERAELVSETYHANWTVSELELELVRRGLRKPPKKRSGTTPLPAGTPATACDLLERMATTLRQQNQDIDFSGMLAKRSPSKPIAAAALLQFLAGEYKREHPGAEFRLTEEAKPNV